ncbi:hypothetical protein KY346_00785 [Candidatus Woesearchaeota archaeon]|nr:hypothetical protein [Candidatus Woesearchaeota archaeon]
MTHSEISNLVESIISRAKSITAKESQENEYRVFVPYAEIRNTGKSKHHVAEIVLTEASAEDARNHAIRQVQDSCMAARSRKDITSFKIVYSDVDVKKITKY